MVRLRLSLGVRRGLSEHHIYALLASAAILFVGFEAVVQLPKSALDFVFVACYVSLLGLLYWWPVPAGVGLAMLHMLRTMIPPLIVGPTDFWGTWLALAVLAYEGPMWLGVSCAVISSGVVSLQGNRMQGVSSIGVMSLALTYWAAYLGGLAVQRWRRSMQRLAHTKELEHELAYERERTRMVHTLHDSVAGSLSYIVLLCRQEATDPHLDASYRNHIKEVEHLVSATLSQIRTEVLGPAMSKTVHNQLPGVPSAQGSELALRCRLANTEAQLAALGFSGHPVVHGDLTCITAERVNVLDQVLAEVGANIAKHGRAGPYVFYLKVAVDGSLTVISSNSYVDHAQSKDLSSGVGLTLLRDSVTELGGSLTIAGEDGEWTLAVRIGGQSHLKHNQESQSGHRKL